MRVLWVFLVFFCFCFSSNAQMQDESTTSTSTSETEMQGDLEITTTTTTTTTIENKTTGDILDGDTGVVATRYEGDMDQDWGGIGSASMPNCPSQFSGGGRCAKGTSNSLTTFQQNISISQFHIEDGGALNWNLDGWHSQSNSSMYFELKGYNENVLLWTDKTDFAYNNHNSNTSYNYAGNYDFAGGLDKLFVSVGGAKNYYFDNVELLVNYNYITTQITEEIFYQIIQTEINNTATNILNTPVVTTNVVNPEPVAPEIPEIAIMTVDLPSVDLTTTVAPIEIQAIDDAGFTPTLNLGEPVATVETITEDIQQVMDLPEIVEVPNTTVSNTNVEPVEMPDTMPTEPEPVEVESQPEPEIAVVEPEPEPESPSEEISSPVNEPGEPVEEVKEEEPTTETTASDEPVNEPKEEPKEIVEEKTEEPVEEKEVAEKTETEEKVEAKEETEEPKEEVKEAKAEEDKPTKKQEAKQEKAKEIMQSFDSQYDAVAQLTTLALVNALGADITTYQQVPTQVQPTWYESKEIYANTILQDPLGNYYGVRDSLVFEKMLGAQYE